MKLVLYNDYQLGVLTGNRVVDAMAALAGQSFRRPQDLIETVIIEWAALRPRIDAATQGKDGVPLDSVTLRPPVPKPPKILCAMEIAALGPPLIVKIHEAQKRTWPRGIDQAFANMVLGRR
jgi:hypothetical protein